MASIHFSIRQLTFAYVSIRSIGVIQSSHIYERVTKGTPVTMLLKRLSNICIYIYIYMYIYIYIQREREIDREIEREKRDTSHDTPQTPFDLAKKRPHVALHVSAVSAQTDYRGVHMRGYRQSCCYIQLAL
jgi:hypothetical protein